MKEKNASKSQWIWSGNVHQQGAIRWTTFDLGKCLCWQAKCRLYPSSTLGTPSHILLGSCPEAFWYCSETVFILVTKDSTKKVCRDIMLSAGSGLMADLFQIDSSVSSLLRGEAIVDKGTVAVIMMRTETSLCPWWCPEHTTQQLLIELLVRGSIVDCAVNLNYSRLAFCSFLHHSKVLYPWPRDLPLRVLPFWSWHWAAERTRRDVLSLLILHTRSKQLWSHSMIFTVIASIALRHPPGGKSWSGEEDLELGKDRC